MVYLQRNLKNHSLWPLLLVWCVPVEGISVDRCLQRITTISTNSGVKAKLFFVVENSKLTFFGCQKIFLCKSRLKYLEGQSNWERCKKNDLHSWWNLPHIPQRGLCCGQGRGRHTLGRSCLLPAKGREDCCKQESRKIKIHVISSACHIELKSHSRASPLRSFVPLCISLCSIPTRASGVSQPAEIFPFRAR